MRINVIFDPNAVLKEYTILQDAQKNGLVGEMITYAKRFMEDAVGQPEGHELGYYNNRTFQLRSSIGAYIFKDGVLVWREGSLDNLSLIEEVIPRGLTLVAMVGKDYASRLEALGYHVITNYGEAVLFDLTKVFISYNANVNRKGNILKGV